MSVRRRDCYALFKDCLWIDIHALAIIAPSGNVKCERSIHNRHGRKEGLAITQRTKNRTAIWLEKICHVETLDMACRKITVHLTPGSWLYHTNVMNHGHLPSVNRPVNPFGFLALTCKIPVGKQFFCVRHAPSMLLSSVRPVLQRRHYTISCELAALRTILIQYEPWNTPKWVAKPS